MDSLDIWNESQNQSGFMIHDQRDSVPMAVDIHCLDEENERQLDHHGMFSEGTRWRSNTPDFNIDNI